MGVKVIEHADVIDVDNDDTPRLDDDAQFAYETFRDALTQSQSPGTIRIYRLPMNEQNIPVSNSGSQIYLDSVPMDRYEFDGLISMLRTKFMRPGEDLLPVRLMGMIQGKRGVAFNRIVIIQRINDATPNVPATTAPDPSTLLRAFAEMQERSAQRMEALFERMTARPSAPALDPMSQMTGLITALAPILAAAAGRPVPASDGGSAVSNMKELFALMQMSREMFANGGTPKTEDDDSDDGMTGVLKAGLNALPSLVQAINSRPQVIQVPASASGQAMLPPPQQPARPPQNIRQPNQAANIPSQNQPTPEQQQMIAELIKNLNQMNDILDANAASNSPQPDAAALAEAFAEQFPDDQIDRLGFLLDRPDLFEYMSKLAPRITAHADWWRAFFAGVRDQFTSDEPGTPA